MTDKMMRTSVGMTKRTHILVDYELLQGYDYYNLVINYLLYI